MICIIVFDFTEKEEDKSAQDSKTSKTVFHHESFHMTITISGKQILVDGGGGRNCLNLEEMYRNNLSNYCIGCKIKIINLFRV